MSAEGIEVDAIVLAEHRGGLFECEAELGPVKRRVLARLAGRLVVNRIRLCEGDVVRLEVNAYDPTRGRITFRVSNSKRGATA
jgi:translation initiation factor IF-1